MPEPAEIMQFIRSMRWQDWVDILVVAVIIYQALRLIRGTKSMQMLLGLVFVIVAYMFSKTFELLTLNWMLSNFLSYIILIMVILFQSDLRLALTRVARLSFGRANPLMLSVIGEIVRVAFTMAEKRVGALIAFEREVGLKNYIEVGTTLDAQVSEDLLMAIFNTDAPLHDGAVVIRNGRIAAAACFLPLSTDDRISRHFGTRHRAAIGLSRDTDALVVVVSEERGIVSLVVDGEVSVVFDQNELREKLTGLLHLTVSAEAPPEEEELHVAK
jgi:diadenylate cyclase